MENKHFKRCSTTYVLREIESKTGNCCVPIRMAQTLTHQMEVSIWSYRNAVELLVGMQNAPGKLMNRIK